MTNHPYILTTWAKRYSIDPIALTELVQLMTGHHNAVVVPTNTRSEAFAQSQVLLEASRVGARLWRNNVGCYTDERGRLIRYGLCNESKQQNSICKSADLIGIKPILIMPDMVGSTIGQFVAREVKKPAWLYSGKGREGAQFNFLQLVLSLGGDGQFATGEGSL